MGTPLKQSLYEILDVKPDAPQDEIHRAFLRAKNTYSPNSAAIYTMFTQEEASEFLRLINEAYAILGNPTNRKNYDLTLRKTVPLSQTTVAPTPALDADFDDDLAIPEASSTWPSPAENVTPPQTNTPPPSADRPSAGVAPRQTRISNFEQDAAFEHEIAQQEVFDGTFLQKVRLYKNISLDQVSEVTRVGRHYLAAVEANDFFRLPAPVFVRGFIQQLAKVLGLDVQKTTDSFMKLFKQTRDGK